jgi:mannose-1-phosphate guanylyltransferase/mannose-6-phosphate isomerase
VYKVLRFHEKPDLSTAKTYLSRGNFYWNSGIFAFSAKTFLEEAKEHAPEIYKPIEKLTFDGMVQHFQEMPDLSLDYAMMEKTKRAVVVPLKDLRWSDVGSWESVYEILEKDRNQNVKIGDVVEIETKDSLLIGSQRVIATIGVEGLVVIETPDIVFVTKRGCGQKIKELLTILQGDADKKKITSQHTTVYRPWGSYTDLEKGDRYRIKRISVNPGECLSLQLHHHRSEHWVVVKGTAKVIVEDEKGERREIFVHENESIYIPKTSKHRLANPGKLPLEVIEVQVGEYIEEDDIVRFEDQYERVFSEPLEKKD